jgi:hypothetical protein
MSDPFFHPAWHEWQIHLGVVPEHYVIGKYVNGFVA